MNTSFKGFNQYCTYHSTIHASLASILADPKTLFDTHRTYRRQRDTVSYLISLCKWVAEHGVGEIERHQILLRATKNKKQWRTMFFFVLKEQITLFKMLQNQLAYVHSISFVLHSNLADSSICPTTCELLNYSVSTLMSFNFLSLFFAS